jgi:hypothetical protein
MISFRCRDFRQPAVNLFLQVTSSTEIFFEATRVTLDCGLRASHVRASPGSGNTGEEALRQRSLGTSPLMSGGECE